MSHEGLRATDELFSVLAGAGNRVGVDLAKGVEARTLFDGRFLSTLETTEAFDARNASLYHLALNLAFAVIGASLQAARYLSVAAGLATVYATFHVARALGGTPREGHVAAAVLAVHPLHVSLSAHARGYALATLLATLATLLLLKRKTAKGSPVTIASYAFAAIAASCSHLLTTYLIGAQSAILAWSWRSRVFRRELACAWLLILVAIAAILLVGAGGGSLIAGRSAHYASAEGLGSLQDLAKSAFLQSVELSGAHAYWSSLDLLKARYSLLLPLVVFAAVLFGVRTAFRKDLHKGALLAASVVAPVLFAVSASILAGHRVPFWPQYAVFATPWVASAVGLAISHQRIGRGVAVITLTILPLGLISRAWPSPPDPLPAIRSLAHAHLVGGGTVIGPDDLLMRAIAVSSLDLPGLRVQVVAGSEHLEFRSANGELQDRVPILSAGLCASFRYLCTSSTRTSPNSTSSAKEGEPHRD